MIEGKQIIGFELSAEGNESFQSVNPALGTKLEYNFHKFLPARPDQLSQCAHKGGYIVSEYPRAPVP